MRRSDKACGIGPSFEGGQVMHTYTKNTCGWDDDRVERLKKWWDEGQSASQIARRLGSVTRNAVIGKIHRLKLPPRSVVTRSITSSRQRRGTAKLRKFRPAHLETQNDRIRRMLRAGSTPLSIAMELKIRSTLVYAVKEMTIPAEPLPLQAATDVARVSFLDLDEIEIEGSKQHCRFIPASIDPKTTKPHEPQFCGSPKLPGLAYCEHHSKRCHNAPSPHIRVPVSDRIKEFA
jgi:GcrA cell cycle regulator